jgi:MoxR-like ATPase
MLEVMNKITGENKLRNIHQRKNLPHIDNKTVITPSIQQKLDKWGNILSQQLINHQGYMIIESDSGTGKNFKIDILGHLTNREVFDISCNQHMEKEDLLFSQEINTEGTYRQPSELIRGIQTPGAIVFLDEVNTLKPGVSKLLNPLLDNRRYINDPQLGKVHVHPSVVIIGAMNPRDYLGTNPLPQEQISRARIVNDEYLPANEEAFMMSKHLDGPIANLSWEEFKTYREQYNTRDEKPNNKIIYNTFKDMKKVVDVAKKLRETTMKTKRGKAEIGEELEWLFSPRESIQIIQDYNFTKNIKTSIENIVLPKIADFEQKEYAENIIKQEFPKK